MGKIIKEIVCENGDCSNKRIKVLPLIGFITVNVIIGLSFSMFCYHVISNILKESIMKKDNKFQENIYLLMKERLGKYMNEGVEQDLEEFLNFVSKQQQREVSTT